MDGNEFESICEALRVLVRLFDDATWGCDTCEYASVESTDYPCSDCGINEGSDKPVYHCCYRQDDDVDDVVDHILTTIGAGVCDDCKWYKWVDCDDTGPCASCGPHHDNWTRE